MTARAKAATALINGTLTKLVRELSKHLTMDEVYGALGPSLLLHALDYTRRAGVPEEAARAWIEECLHNLYQRGVDIKTWREPS